MWAVDVAADGELDQRAAVVVVPAEADTFVVVDPGALVVAFVVVDPGALVVAALAQQFVAAEAAIVEDNAFAGVGTVEAARTTSMLPREN